jgi:hypothetical protein
MPFKIAGGTNNKKTAKLRTGKTDRKRAPRDRHRHERF